MLFLHIPVFFSVDRPVYVFDTIHTHSVPHTKMPLWEIFHPVAAFAEPHAKAWLAGNITALYVAVGLPAFYVNVFFHLLSGEDQYVGGHPAEAAIGDPAPLERPFVRFKLTHLAIHNEGNLTAERSLCDRLNTVGFFLLANLVRIVYSELATRKEQNIEY